MMSRTGSLKTLFTTLHAAQLGKSGHVTITHLRALSTILPKNDEKSSYIHVPGTEPLLGLHLGQVVESMADRFGDRMAVIDREQGIRKTFAQLQKDVQQMATGLLALNLKRGDRIAIWSPNCYEWAVTQHASAIAGLILVTINPAYQPSEFDYCLQKLGIRAVVMPKSFKTQDYYKILLKLSPEIAESKTNRFKSKKYPSFDTIILMTDEILPGTFRYRDVIDAGGSQERVQLNELQKDLRMDDPVVIMFTSGTTGQPKAAIHTHHAFVNSCIAFDRRIRYVEGVHRVCVQVPLFHIFGYLGATGNSIVTGMCVVFPSRAFRPEESLKAIAEEKCTAIYGTPTMYIDVMGHPDFGKTDFSSMTRGFIGGAPCPPSVLQAVMQKMNCPGLLVVYGSTESCGTGATHDLQESINDKIDNCGRPMQNIEVKIVDAQGGIVPLGVPGEICTRSPYVMMGYWGDEEKTKETIKAGWFHSGDLGALDKDGYIRVVGRIKDMIIRGGENIYPREIEDHLNTHPDIFDVHVIGVSDDRMGEEVCAWIKLKSGHTMTHDDVRQFCKGKLSHFKIPRYIRFVDDFPKTLSGKVQKIIMREEMEAILRDGPK